MNTTAIETDQAENGTPGPWTIAGPDDDQAVWLSNPISNKNGCLHVPLIDARLIVAAVNAVRAAMPDLTDEQRIERLKDLTQPESAKSMGPALVARVKIRAALEAIGR